MFNIFFVFINSTFCRVSVPLVNKAAFHQWWLSSPKLRFETDKSCPLRCTSVLSDDSELSTLCDEEPLGTGEVGYGPDEEETRPELLSSSEDSSPEADLPFSKKFLNVFVNSTSRSSSRSHRGLFRHRTL